MVKTRNMSDDGVRRSGDVEKSDSLLELLLEKSKKEINGDGARFAFEES